MGQFPIIMRMITELRTIDGERVTGIKGKMELFELWDKLDADKQELLVEMARLMVEPPIANGKR